MGGLDIRYQRPDIRKQLGRGDRRERITAEGTERAERERRLGRQDAEVEVPSKLRASLRRAKGALLRMTGVFLVVHMGRGRWCGTDGKRDSSGLKARATGLE
jgi:hypothetical protein